MTPLTLDAARAEAFAERMLTAVNESSIVLMTSIGHRTGLFDALAGMPPATSETVAESAGLVERYVREWLNAMVVGGVVEYTPETGHYTLPPEHAACLTRKADENLAQMAQWLPLLSTVENKVVDCFREGGGVDYSEFERFHEVMAAESDNTVVGALLEHILPLAPDVVERLERGIDVLEVGCGRGRALNLLARTFPRSRFLGYDFNREAVEYARGEANGRDNIEFVMQDATKIAEEDAYDLVLAFDAIHDQIDPARVLAGIRRATRLDGMFLMQDIRASSHVQENLDHPLGPFLYTISCTHCMTVSLANDGAGLGTCWGEELAVEMLRDAGFREVDVRRLDHDIINNYYLARG